MKKIFLLLLLISFFCLTFAGKAYKTTPRFIYRITPTDTVPYVINEDELMDYADSVMEFPAYDLYNGWDTHTIHYAKFDINTLKDSTRQIALFDNNSCGFVSPFSGGNITSGFGPRKRRFHYGTDIDLQTGDAVNAAFDGRVRIAQRSKTYGNVIVIRHSNGLETYYAHLSKLKVEPGEEVKAGEVIGLGGNTGRSRGSHLHFEVRYLGQPIDPCGLISFKENKLISDTLCINKNTFNYINVAKRYSSKTNYNKGAKVHIVKKGDTLFGIAKRYGTSAQSIYKKNGLKATSTLHLGQRILL